MKKLLIGAAAMLAVALPGVAAAQTTAHIGASYANYDYESDDADMFGLDGAFAHDFSNGWTVQGEAATDRIDFDGAEVGVAYGAVNFGMRSDNHALYGFVGLADVIASSVATVGVGGQMHFEQATVNGSVSYGDIGEALIDSGNITNVHLDGTWFINDNFGISAEAGWTDVEINSSDADWTTLGVGASYRFTDAPWTVYANYQNRDFEGGDIDSFRIGFRFDIGTGSSREQARSGASWNGARALYEEARALSAIY